MRVQTKAKNRLGKYDDNEKTTTEQGQVKNGQFMRNQSCRNNTRCFEHAFKDTRDMDAVVGGLGINIFSARDQLFELTRENTTTSYDKFDETNLLYSCLLGKECSASIGSLHCSNRRASNSASSNNYSNQDDIARYQINEKIGHRRVDEGGVVSYKRCPVSELSGALRLGIQCSIISLQPDDINRDVLLQDFSQIIVHDLPALGTKTTPAHKFRDFAFRAYAPVAFHHFRSKFNINADDYMLSLCCSEWTELPNAGVSGSIFYVTRDDRFIIKTVDAKEANFLISLLPGYYMNLVQNPETMLPKFFGFYCYRKDKDIRVMIMNNLVSSEAEVTERYDLKGSKYKRKASERERRKQTPTLKDLDFMDRHPFGIMLRPAVYDEILHILERDLRVLRSFGIMDYSLLVVLCKPIDARNQADGALHSRNMDDLVNRKGIYNTVDDHEIPYWNADNCTWFIHYIPIIIFLLLSQKISSTLKA